MRVDELKRKYLTGDFKLKGEFTNDEDRESVLSKCEKYAGWTIPSLFPEEELQDSDELQTDYQSVGAQAVTNLSNKLMMALFQPSRPFFRMQLTQEQQLEVQASGLSEAQMDAALSEAERTAMKEFDKSNQRVVLHDVMQQLIVTGNCLYYTPKNEDAVVYTLKDYKIKRDLRGNLVKCILRETKSVSGLSDELQELAYKHNYREDQEVTIYTAVCRTGADQFFVWQELEDVAYCHKRVGSYKKQDLPWNPLVWKLARGNDYGTGLVEEYSGDFAKLSTLGEAIMDYSIVMTDIKNLVRPDGMTDVKELTESASGAYVQGREEDLYVHQPQVANVADFLSGQFDATARRIGAAFLLNTAVTRDAERVTAEEIRMQAQELEGSLGGVYSRLANNLQAPIARREIGKLNPIFKDIEPVIVTGLESLSRHSELGNFRAFMSDLIMLSDVPDDAKVWMRMEDIIAMLGAGHGVNYKKFLNSKEEVEQERARRMQQQAQFAGQEAGMVEQAKVEANGQTSG